MNQILQINLASPQSTACQNFKEIREAVYNASLRLYSKHGVQIKDVQTVGDQVIMHVMIPDEIASNFQLGYHLRGVSVRRIEALTSTGLMKHYKEKYSKLLVAKKLLTYTVIPMQTYTNETELTMNERFSAGIHFLELLKNTDETSMAKIRRILKILQED